MQLNNKITKAILSSLILLTICSCDKLGQIVATEEPALEVPLTELSRSGGSQFIKLTAPAAWNLSFDFGEDVTAWAWVNQDSGNGSQSGIILSWEESPDESGRVCQLILNCEGERVSADLVQPAKTVGGVALPTELKADTPGKWMELPALDDHNLYFLTHSTSIKGKPIRNWSCYYDPEAKLSPWIAYPLNRELIGDVVSRKNEWGMYDPKIPQIYQQRLYSPYRRGTDGSSYQRGHQIPSADRLASREDNRSTFYVSNMVPQKGELNSYAWASLEIRVRDWSRQMDTLYVVTGVDYRGSRIVSYDNSGTEIPVPTAFYKALLGYDKKGSISPGTGGYVGIAFYFEHRGYGNEYWSQRMTIDELEDELGYDFFVNLPDAIGSTMAGNVESKIDSWWQNH